MQSWESYMRDQEAAAMGEVQGKLEAAIVALNDGRNLRCWPLCSFGWKDADLDAEGCTGIKSIDATDDEMVKVIVGGHKTFGIDPDWTEAQVDTANTCLPVGYACDGDHEEWTSSTQVEIEVPWVLSPEGEPSYELTAAAIVEAARNAIAPFEKDVAEADAAMNKVTEEG
jgi:hypothetical protein